MRPKTEAVEIIRRLWSEDRVTHSGRHWQFSDAAIAPRPLQAPRPPILIGAQVDAAIARAARIGDGWLSVPTSTLDQVDAQLSAFKSARSAAKLPPAQHFCRLLEVGCAQDNETAIRRSAPFLMEKYKSYASWGLDGVTLDPDAAPEQQFRALLSKRFAVGAPASVVDMLVAQHRSGIKFRRSISPAPKARAVRGWTGSPAPAPWPSDGPERSNEDLRRLPFSVTN